MSKMRIKAIAVTAAALALAACGAAPSVTQTTTAPAATVAASTKAAPAASTKAPAPAATKAAPKPTALEDNGWTVASLKTSKEFTGDFSGVARITNGTGSEAKVLSVTFTLVKGNDVIATLSGVASNVAAGKTATVQLLSTEKYVSGSFTTEFQATSF